MSLTAYVVTSGVDEVIVRIGNMNRRCPQASKLAMTAAIRPMQQEARRLVAKDTGTLEKAVDMGVRQYRTATIGMVGIGQSHTKPAPANKMKSHEYAHLIEDGHGGPSPAKAYPFLMPAYDNKKSEVMSVYSYIMYVELTHPTA